MQEKRLQYAHFFFSAFLSSFSLRSSTARRFRAASSSSSNSLNPPPSPIRFVPACVPFTFTSPSFAELHWLQSFRRAQFQLPQTWQCQSPTLVSIPGGSFGTSILRPPIGGAIDIGGPPRPMLGSPIGGGPPPPRPIGGIPWVPGLREPGGSHTCGRTASGLMPLASSWERIVSAVVKSRERLASTH
eukprot:CAMPEP_0181184706 /NCGR_PEP_ID=MMETSP1096-20121128/9111_1 /TAXON_ID=156174 ORGANISM="Chrysochromulina ericina, Strain CCMP281" /NCGR_SAMPLE_ID=MMETSP1096 /ASSEMBLY_ACC=CAM_ASM_000453 /LENGTH=186 /DNA_ID=CAMNT_0023273489 /DNA_START=356 /DNA_END=913 /DNA_ORIENTATION=+